MERVFTEDHGRYKKGDRKDWPITTWRAFFPDFDKFTSTVDEAIASNTVRKSKNYGRANG